MEAVGERTYRNWWERLEKENIFFLGFITGIMAVAVMFLLFYFV